MSASIRHRLEYALLRVVVFLVGRFSWTSVGRLGRALGSITFHVLRIRRRVTLENLGHAFPDWDEARRLRVARDSYRHFGITFLEVIRLSSLGPADLRKRMQMVGEEHLAAASAKGRGIVLCTGHFGNWELMGSALADLARPRSMWVVAKTQKNGDVDRFVTEARERAGLRVLKVESGVRRMLAPLRREEMMTILFDQDAGRKGVFVDFLGRAASTPVGVVRLARLARCPILPGYSIRQADGRYIGYLEEPIHLRADLPAEEAEAEALGRVVRRLEDRIRSRPDHWFWMHRRWKTRPPAGALSGG